jgi:hypothetical protein
MGWWRDKTGDLIGDGPADHISDFLAEVGGEAPLSLATVLAALDGALRRNPAQFVADPDGVDGTLAAHDTGGAVLVWQSRDVPADLVEGCHGLLEAIAIDYLDNSLEALPTCSEVLASFCFVLGPRVPDTVTAPPGVDLFRIAYIRGNRRFVRDVQLADLERIADGFGLERDRDAIPQDKTPGFASWTRHPDLGLEVDWHADVAGVAHVEIRGADAPRLAHALQTAGVGTIVQDPQAALTDLLTVPQRTAPASASAAQIRWEALCVAVTSASVFDDISGGALISAGLADSDWRVRMVAIWAVACHRMPGLAEKVQAAALPKAGYAGLSQDDRRVLLCLRDVATARSAGRRAPLKPGANPAFVTQVTGFADAVPDRDDTRAAALIATLLRVPLGTAAGVHAPAWRVWAGLS